MNLSPGCLINKSVESHGDLGEGLLKTPIVDNAPNSRMRVKHAKANLIDDKIEPSMSNIEVPIRQTEAFR